MSKDTAAPSPAGLERVSLSEGLSSTKIEAVREAGHTNKNGGGAHSPQDSNGQLPAQEQAQEEQEAQAHAELEAERRFEVFDNFIRDWFHAPDLEPVHAAMAAALSHRLRDEPPVWMMVIGPSSTAKSSLVFPAVMGFPDTRKVDMLTPATFLSGLPRSKGGQSLLHDIGCPKDRSGVLIFSDFSTIIDTDDKTLKEISRQLRKVYDGELTKDTGSRGTLHWQGKVTVVAMCTPAMEFNWQRMADLGERFVQVRWGRGDGLEMSRKALDQSKTRGGELYARVKEMGQETVFGTGAPLAIPDMTTAEAERAGLLHLAEAAVLLRTAVKRDDKGAGVGGRRIVNVSETEGPGRFIRSLGNVARCHAAMFQRRVVGEKDYQLTARVALDSVPGHRMRVVRRMPFGEKGEEMAPICLADLLEMGRPVPKEITKSAVEDLTAVGVLRKEESGAEVWVEFTEGFAALRRRAGALWR